jgi:excisionase family DNA binding protein
MSKAATTMASGPASKARLLRVEDVADRLSVSPKTVRRLVAAGRLQAVQIGAAVRFSEAGLQRFIDSASARRAKQGKRNKSKP